jgi:hypothetical protein
LNSDHKTIMPAKTKKSGKSSAIVINRIELARHGNVGSLTINQKTALAVDVEQARWLSTELDKLATSLEQARGEANPIPFDTRVWPPPASREVSMVVGLVNQRTGAFGHNDMIVLSEDGKAWRISAMLLSPPRPWIREGFPFRCRVHSDGHIIPGSAPFSFECGERLKDPPQGVYDEAWERHGHITLTERDLTKEGDQKFRSGQAVRLTPADFGIPADVAVLLNKITLVLPEGPACQIKTR